MREKNQLRGNCYVHLNLQYTCEVKSLFYFTFFSPEYKTISLFPIHFLWNIYIITFLPTTLVYSQTVFREAWYWIKSKIVKLMFLYVCVLIQNSCAREILINQEALPNHRVFSYSFSTLLTLIINFMLRGLNGICIWV